MTQLDYISQLRQNQVQLRHFYQNNQIKIIVTQLKKDQKLNIHAVRIKKKVIYTHYQHTFIIIEWCDCILGDDNLFKTISCINQRSLFLLHFSLVRKCICGLDIVSFDPLLHTKSTSSCFLIFFPDLSTSFITTNQHPH